MLGNMLGSELGRRNLRETFYTWGQVEKISILIGTILVTCPLPTFIKNIHNLEAPKPAIVPMYDEVYIGPDKEVKIWVIWKINLQVRLGAKQR